MRPRKRFDFKCPIEMMSELMAKYHEAPPSTIDRAALRNCIRQVINHPGLDIYLPAPKYCGYSMTPG